MRENHLEKSKKRKELDEMTCDNCFDEEGERKKQGTSMGKKVENSSISSTR